ncbi:hypothetical protein AB0H77_39620, partial [Streptomyces sp. NPDC050844]|uniref:morphogenic membrane protein MmpB n=1 Tax=Streptomyces sp. NPDC050844 TaxID=3155790 RepID=UPI0033CCC4FB
PGRLSTRTQAPRRRRPQYRVMLWSDPENNPPKDMRDMQVKMRRAGLVLALAMVIAMFVLGMH